MDTFGRIRSTLLRNIEVSINSVRFRPALCRFLRPRGAGLRLYRFRSELPGSGRDVAKTPPTRLLRQHTSGRLQTSPHRGRDRTPGRPLVPTPSQSPQVQLLVTDPCAIDQFWHVDNTAPGLTLFIPLTQVRPSACARARRVARLHMRLRFGACVCVLGYSCRPDAARGAHMSRDRPSSIAWIRVASAVIVTPRPQSCPPARLSGAREGGSASWEVLQWSSTGPARPTYRRVSNLGSIDGQRDHHSAERQRHSRPRSS